MYYEKIIIGYIFWVALVFMFFAEKPKDFGKLAGKLMGWWFSPLVLTISLIVGYFERKKMRWFKDRWALVALNQTYKWLIYGMTGLTKKYG